MIPLDEARAILRTALIENAIRLGEGITASGTPQGWLLDCRALTLQQPILSHVSRLLWSRIAQYDPEVIAGSTLSADPLVVGLLDTAFSCGTTLKGLIVRKEAKRYGTAKLIEGPELSRGQRVVIVDDLVNSGTTLERIISLLETREARVVAVTVLVDFQTAQARHIFERHRIPLESLFTLTDLGLAPSLPSGRNRVRLLWSVASKYVDNAVPTVTHDDRSRYTIYSDGNPIAVVDTNVTKGATSSLHPTIDVLNAQEFDTLLGASRLPGLSDSETTRSKAELLPDSRGAELMPNCDEKVFGIAASDILSLTHNGASVYATIRTGALMCVKRETGSCVWKRRLLPKSNGRPLIVNDMVVISMTDSFIGAFDSTNGNIRWISKLESPVLTGPYVVAESFLAITLRSGFVALVDGRNGELLWRYFAGKAACSAIPSREDFVVATSDGNILGFGIL